MRRHCFYLTVVMLAVVMAGCGGGGGGSPAIETGSATRQIQPGDVVTYSISGTASPGNVPITGTMTETTYATNLPASYGTRTVKQVAAFNFTGVGTVTAVITMFVDVAADGAMYHVGTYDGVDITTLQTVIDDPLSYPGNLFVGQLWSTNVVWSDSTREITDNKVVALESVNGRMAYKIHSTSTRDGDSMVEDDWFVPDLGYPVKSQFSMTTEGVTFNLTATLTSLSLQ